MPLVVRDWESLALGRSLPQVYLQCQQLDHSSPTSKTTYRNLTSYTHVNEDLHLFNLHSIFKHTIHLLPTTRMSNKSSRKGQALRGDALEKVHTHVNPASSFWVPYPYQLPTYKGHIIAHPPSLWIFFPPSHELTHTNAHALRFYGFKLKIFCYICSN